MIKFLLAILIVITGLKLFADSGALVYKYATVKLLQDEEGKNETDEREKNSKEDSEDIFYSDYLTPSALFNSVSKSHSTLSHHKLHSGFVDKPLTPPDIIYFFGFTFFYSSSKF